LNQRRALAQGRALALKRAEENCKEENKQSKGKTEESQEIKNN